MCCLQGTWGWTGGQTEIKRVDKKPQFYQSISLLSEMLENLSIPKHIQIQKSNSILKTKKKSIMVTL